MNWCIQVMNQYAEFNGRARRREVGCFLFINILIPLFIYIVGELFGLFGIPGIIYCLVVLITGLVVAVRRLSGLSFIGFINLLI
jgi:uncharacterized membrane protein YhaH (DUF805 family)